MILWKKPMVMLAIAATSLASYNACYADPKVPENITTPDTVHTQAVGDLHFNDGYPTDDTISECSPSAKCENWAKDLKK